MLFFSLKFCIPADYKDISSLAFTSTNISYQFHDDENALYFNMNSKISHPTAIHHFSTNKIGICDSGISDVLQSMSSKEIGSEGIPEKSAKDIYILGTSTGKWSQSEHVFNFHVTKFPTESSTYIKKEISDMVVLRKIEGL